MASIAESSSRLIAGTTLHLRSVARRFVLCLALIPAVGHSANDPPACAFDRQQMLALDEDAFDQDLKGGWRVVANQEGCQSAAADLIRDYRELRGPHSWRVMIWHEGQLRAMSGDSRAAIPLMEQSRAVSEEESLGWNQYVNATIAFLRKDRQAFDKAFSELSALPRPKWWGGNFSTKGRQWPMNLSVLDGLSRCWKSSYENAYTECGSKPEH
jgi:hypothetical protein